MRRVVAVVHEAKMRILAVDDEPFIRELLPLLAAKAGFPDVTTVSSGQDALDALTSGENAFDCLLLDVNMPEMDGIELCCRIREIESYRRAPIIMLTAMADQAHIDRAFKAGATDYATKPIDIQELGARLRVAEELSKAWHEVEVARGSSAKQGSTSSQRHRFNLSDAISVDGAKDILNFAAVKNYLWQCSRAGLAASQVVAVKLDSVEVIYARATTEEFTYVLRAVASAIHEVLQTKNCLIAYAGSGVFIVISNKASTFPSVEIETDVQSVLDEKHMQYDSGIPLDVEISIGNPISPDIGDVEDASKSLERAIARAEQRSATKRDEPAVVNIRRELI
jgi:PleD family two-component response regulator